MNVERLYSTVGVMLTRYGSRWRALCPFHKEKEPSFVVYSDGGYHCFGCGAHGTAETLAKHFNVPYLVFPYLLSSRDSLLFKVNKLKKKLEPEFNLLIEDESLSTKLKLYDKLDALFMDVRALMNDADVSLLDVVAFVNQRYEGIKKSIKSK